MGMSAFYGPPRPEPDMINLIHQAINAGVTFLDTSDFYGPKTNEILLGKALKDGMREKVEVATKFGIKCDGVWEVNGHPAYVRAACEASLQRLDIDYIDLYYQHRIDTRVPIEITMGELKNLVEEGKIKYVGLSEASASTIRRAHAVHPITAIQLECSLVGVSSGDRKVLCLTPDWSKYLMNILMREKNHELNLGFRTDGGEGIRIPSDSRAYGGKHVSRSEIKELILAINRQDNRTRKKGCTTSQLSLAWVHHQGDDVVPIPGTTKIQNFEQNIGALSVKLTPEDMAELESIASASSVKGDRYNAGFPTYLNSETPQLSSWKA
ncbi:hypothetical protein E3N88_01248 [Mikania micrantha]|uniref:NADP-dependent oxidoreductase domain-containing protein n=1 Tax=Mikania micrantha TaxID=192012 RepID=A0A5N6Q0Q2_9ASTR|nr:hypothetical protein E3N88_01248 [Mikania micrantha]